MTPATPPGDAPSRIGARDIVRRYRAVVANDGITFDVAPGTVHAIVGENGAGKSTLMRILAGIETPDNGTVTIGGDPVTMRSVRDGHSHGIGMIHQELSIVPTLTLLENLVLGHEPTDRLGRLNKHAALTEAERISSMIGWEVPWGRLAAEVDIGVRQRVELMRQLYRGADILILDEPTAVLTPNDTDAFLQAMAGLRRRGTTMLFINHKLDEVAAIADTITVIRRGRVIATVAADTPTDDLAAMIVGEGLEPTDLEHRSPVNDAVILDVKALGVLDRERTRRVENVNLNVRRGEIVGIYGVAGSGQEELLRSVVGHYVGDRDHSVTGSVQIAGHDVTSLPVGTRRQRGMAFISPDRKSEGLAVTESLVDNGIAGHHHNPPIVKRFGLFSTAATRRFTDQIIQDYDVRCGSASDAASSLSGGNQQRFIFGRELAHQPLLLVVAQPTRGIDVRGVERIRAELLAARAAGCAILLASEELDEVIDLADRVVVMRAGRAVGELDRSVASRQRIGELMLAGL